MRKARYPTSFERDFDDTVVTDAKLLIYSDISEIFPILEESRVKNRMLLVAVLRHLLELPIDAKSASLMGWFTFNDLVPKQSLYLYMKRLGWGISTEEGRKSMIIFARAIFPKLNKYHVFAKLVLSIPGLQFTDSYLYAAITQVLWSGSKIDTSGMEAIRIIPDTETKKFANEQTNSVIAPFEMNDVYIPDLKQTIYSSLEFAKTMPEEEKIVYCIRICLGFPPPVTNLHTPNQLHDLTLLHAACAYGCTMLHNSRRCKWDAYDVEPQLERLGSWIGALCVVWGRPPPLHCLNIPKLLREAVSIGVFMHALVFVKAIYSRLGQQYAPPNPLTVAVLEVVAAVSRSPHIREDVRNMILSFGEVIGVEVSAFYRRDIELPLQSPDCISRFIVVDNEVVFQNPAHFPASGIQMAPKSGMTWYFNYLPDKTVLPPELHKMFEDAKKIEKYYFVHSPASTLLSETTQNRRGLLQCLISLGLASLPILARLGSKLFDKMVKRTHKVDITSIFRCAFPNKYMLNACIKRRCVNLQQLFVLFTELLTNPDTMKIARPMIESFMPMCLANVPKQNYTAIRTLTRYATPQPGGPMLYPTPNPAHIPLLRAFITLVKEKNEETMNEFSKNLAAVTPAHIESLFALTLSAAKKRRSPRSATKIDYSAVDGLCSALGKCAGRVDMNKLVNHCFSAAQNIAAVAIREYPLPFFRLINGLFTCMNIRQKDGLMSFLTAIGPSKQPTFTVCWMQLVMHRIALPQLIRTNELKPVRFCVDFVCTCMELAMRIPEAFYRPVARILMTIAASAPMFFIAYHAILVEALPTDYVQFRNIILSAVPQRFEESVPPPMGFNYTSTLKSNAALRAVIDPLLSTTSEELVQSPQSNAQFISPILRRAISESRNDTPKIWQFVIYCITNITNNVNPDEMHYGTDDFKNIPIVELFIAICNSFYDDFAKHVFEAIADNIRYPNVHTEFASNLLLVIFEASDSINREILLSVLMRRLLCVTSPPSALRGVFNQICEKYGPEITEMLNKKKEGAMFENARRIIASCPVRRTPSGRL